MLVYLLCHQYFHQAFEHWEVIPSRLAFMKNKIKQKLKVKKNNKINDKNVNSKGGETCNIIAQAAVNLSIHSLIRTISL